MEYFPSITLLCDKEIMTQQKESIRLLEEALKELESSKGSVLSAIQKISRVSQIMDNSDIYKWCQIQLGEQKYAITLRKFVDVLVARQKNDSKALIKEQTECEAELKKLGFIILMTNSQQSTQKAVVAMLISDL
jgi:hypothetical protein